MNDANLKEILEFGYIQEANRQFFHPLGLALYISFDENDNPTHVGIMDSREDDEGFNFADGVLNPDKTIRIAVEQSKRENTRKTKLGYNIQPME